MRLFQNTCEFAYPWEQVTAANWNKYPNEVSTHVIAVDVLRRELSSSGRKLVTERLITVKQSVPRWVLLVVGASEKSFVREVSTVDLDTKTLTMRSCNLTFWNIMKVYETVKYTPDELRPDSKTVFEQEAQITVCGTLGRFCSKVEEWSVQRFGENAKKGKMGFDLVLKVFNEHWNQINSDIGSVFNETVEDVRSTAGNLIKETERTYSNILGSNQEMFSEAFNEK
ncbi:Protein UPS2, mitochondrial [Nakaseomyces bracarensis]|uniref:Protein UPS2, mitochondrial n=1 Tax=Nakaseomyces bracarensis TaxID=273131 RepID=A0ABR4NUE4_9SACH